MAPLGYASAKKLNSKSHAHKQALYPFLRAVGSFFADAQHALPALQRRVMTHGNRKMFVVDLKIDGGIATPEPPLNLTVRDLPSRRLVGFTQHIERVTKTTGSKAVLDHLHERASIRNQLLYADSKGLPRVEGDTECYVLLAKDRVLILLQVFCLIFPHTTRAPLVQQSLYAFLLMLGRVDAADINW